MTQGQWIVLAFKVVTISGFVSLVTWIAQYHLYTRGAWRKNLVGRTFVIKTSLIALLLVPTILSLFFHLNPYIVGWVDVCILGAVTPVMWWRIAVWRKIHIGGDILAARLAELEEENARLRERLGET